MDGVQLDSLDYRALKRLMARSTELEGFIRRRLSEGAAYARSISPDAPPYGAGYIAGFGVEVHQFPDGVPIGTLFNSSPIWAVIEKGSGQGTPRQQGGSSPPFHILARTLFELNRTG